VRRLFERKQLEGLKGNGMTVSKYTLIKTVDNNVNWN
jgi:hypothetical protein